MPATEVLWARLLPGSDISDPDNHAAKVFQETLDTVSKQDGSGQIYFGMHTEDANTLQLIVEWEDLDKHKDFMASSIYQPFLKRFLSMTTGLSDVLLVHVDFKPDGGLIKALTAPITSIATFHYKDGNPPSDYEEGAQTFFKKIIEGGIVGERGHAFGLTHEDVESEGVKGRSAVLIVGWDSKEAYDQFHAGELYKDNSKYLANGVVKKESNFVQFLNAVPS